ncbi:MAG: DUF2252 domain-containing protein [Nocardiopsaceae bacterium]|jgi:uncharacterized protein (DUF2252 family)|nr:DUF2252 domain-containing protein [Nocardiopsaceae bacterium]
MMKSGSPTASHSPAALKDLPATSGERRASGKAARKRVRRGTLGSWAEADRRHDALETILAQNKIRVPELVPIRHQRMAVSPWNYYRGAAAVMAADLGGQPDSGLMVQLGGDAHVLNFGLWATPERNLSFDLRDFDETLPGPFEWDVKRFAASLVVAARENGIKPARAAAAVTAGVEAYCRRMRRYAAMPELDIWYASTHYDRLVKYFEEADRGQVSIHIEKRRRRRTSRGAFTRLTAMAGGRPRITENPPVRVAISDDEQAELVDHLLAGYRLTLQEDRRKLFDRFTLVDVVRQVVGVGSVGMRVYLLLLEGRSGDDPLFLQAKQAGPSVYEAHTQPSSHGNHGERVISGKRLAQSATDIFVGWGSLHGWDYYVRQFRDMKIVPTTELIAPRLAEFATASGGALARAHARTGDPVAIDGYIGKGSKFTTEIGRFARRYADQNERDHAQLTSAIAAGAVQSLPA